MKTIQSNTFIEALAKLSFTSKYTRGKKSQDNIFKCYTIYIKIKLAEFTDNSEQTNYTSFCKIQSTAFKNSYSYNVRHSLFTIYVFT